MKRFCELAGGVSVSEFLLPQDVHSPVGECRTFINNRPDGEAPERPSSAEVEAAAHQAHLGYAYLPVTKEG